MQTMILDLNYDVLKTIMLLVVASAGGATDLAKTMAVSPNFAKFKDDKDVLKVVNFGYFVLPLSIEHCQHTKSLFTRCAEAGNIGAQTILAQVILLSFSQFIREPDYVLEPVLEPDTLLEFLSYFMPNKTLTCCSAIKRFTHFELVSLFLRRFSFFRDTSIWPHVKIYVDHFAFGLGNIGSEKFYRYLHWMYMLLSAITEAGTRLRYHSPISDNGQIESNMRNAGRVMYFLDMTLDHYFYYSGIRMFPEDWEMLKRECLITEDEVSSSEGYGEPVEESQKILYMGKRFFNHIAYSVPVTRDLALPLGHDWASIQEACIHCARVYYKWKRKVALAFDEIFLPKIQV